MILLSKLQRSYSNNNSFISVEKFCYQQQGEQEALKQFLYGLRPDIQYLVSIRQPRDLEEAISEAKRIEKETRIRFNMDRNRKPYIETAAIRLAPTKLYCNYCKKSDHSEEGCRNKAKESKFCEYCKIRGHSFEGCGSIRKDIQNGIVVKEKVRSGATTASSPAETKTAYSAPVARPTDARGHNKSGPRHYELSRQTDPRQERNRERYEGQGGPDQRTDRPRRDQKYQGSWRPNNRGERYQNHYGSRRNSHRYTEKEERHPRSDSRDLNDYAEYREDIYRRNDSIQWKDRHQQKNDRNHNEDHRYGDNRGDTYDNTYSQGNRDDSTSHLNF